MLQICAAEVAPARAQSSFQSSSSHRGRSPFSSCNRRRPSRSSSQKSNCNRRVSFKTTYRHRSSSRDKQSFKYTDCYSSGSDGHARRACKFYNAKCQNCGKIGHIAQICKKGTVRTIQVTSDDDNDIPVLNISDGSQKRLQRNYNLQMEVKPNLLLTPAVQSHLYQKLSYIKFKLLCQLKKFPSQF